MNPGSAMTTWIAWTAPMRRAALTHAQRATSCAMEASVCLRSGGVMGNSTAWTTPMKRPCAVSITCFISSDCQILQVCCMHPAAKTCDEDKFACLHNETHEPQCIPLSWLCDGERNCLNGVDETPSSGCRESISSISELKNSNGRMIIIKHSLAMWPGRAMFKRF